MRQKHLKQVKAIPSEDLEDWGKVPKPLSDQVSQLRGKILSSNADGSQVGVWESTPGKWIRLIMDAETATFITGKAIFTPDGGTPIHIEAGDMVYFPANSKGVWEIIETTRKTYLTYKNNEST
ncbi:MAG: cupin domain-containing protein [Pelagibacteraceae bacterium]|nr:cupin domain-containing protein [Pelagibacteraceae bacterium]PHX88886.1 MAG: cupin [Pelagibacteraceae bacterium]